MFGNRKPFLIFRLSPIYVLLYLFIVSEAENQNPHIIKRLFRSAIIDNDLQYYDDDNDTNNIPLERIIEDIKVQNKIDKNKQTERKDQDEKSVKENGQYFYTKNENDIKIQKKNYKNKQSRRKYVDKIRLTTVINGKHLEYSVIAISDPSQILRDGEATTEARTTEATTPEETTYGTTVKTELEEGDTREGICKRYLRDTDHFRKTTPLYNESWEHVSLNRTDCCFNKKRECYYAWYDGLINKIPYYFTNRTYRSIDVCCEGYENDKRRPYDSEGRLLCAPICFDPCVMATCATPNNCTCLPGYVKIKGSKTDCQPHCEHNCGGKSLGECRSPEFCVCRRGYKYDKESKKCISHCRKTCINSVCTGPSTCTCRPGYRLDRKDRYRCNPICKKCPSFHGECVAPNRCSCHKGYHLEDHHCYAECDKFCGLNGTCIDKGGTLTCICHKGYTFDERIQECVPLCKHCTVGGVCIRPNKCRCFPGYVSTKEGGCVFVCSFECGLGRCIGKNICQCPKGYIFNKTAVGPKCAPYCRGCELGECIGPNNCQCPNGYVYHSPKEGDRRIRCMKLKKEYRYYDDKICKFVYDEKKRLDKLEIWRKNTRRAKLKWEEMRRRKKMEYEEKLRREKERKEKERAYYIRFKAQRRVDKVEWIKKQRKENELKLERERIEDERIRKMYAEYRYKIDNNPTVTWQNFARVAVSSLWFGPFGIVFW